MHPIRRLHRPSAVALAVAASLFAMSAQALDSPLAADTYVSAANPALNFGAQATLNVGAGSMALIGFDLSTLPAGVTPVKLVKATLVLYVNRIGVSGAVEVQTTMSGWAESTVTNATAPVLSGAGTGPTIAVPQGAQYVSVDVTNQVKAWLSGSPNYGLAITPALSAPGTSVFFDSKESTTTGHTARLDLTLADQGPAGPAGVAGAAGPTGPTGPSGAGVPGPAGPTGAAGPAGPTGNTGPAGAPGATGAASTVPGPQGPTGPQGSTGAQGPQGVAGSPGVAGPLGATGAKGDTGPAGPTGLQGPAGATGATGPTGSNGATGPQGLQGPYGPTGFNGPAGPMGPTGATGSTGPQGATGPASPSALFKRAVFNVKVGTPGTIVTMASLTVTPPANGTWIVRGRGQCRMSTTGSNRVQIGAAGTLVNAFSVFGETAYLDMSNINPGAFGPYLYQSFSTETAIPAVFNTTIPISLWGMQSNDSTATSYNDCSGTLTITFHTDLP